MSSNKTTSILKRLHIRRKVGEIGLNNSGEKKKVRRSYNDVFGKLRLGGPGGVDDGGT